MDDDLDGRCCTADAVAMRLRSVEHDLFALMSHDYHLRAA